MSWEEQIGKYPSLDVPKVQVLIAYCMGKTANFVRKNIATACKDVDDDFKDPHVNSLSFDEEKTLEDFDGDKKNKPKFTYEAQAAVQEEYEAEDGKKKKRAVKGQKKTVTKAKAKWFTATAEFKSSINFLLHRFVKEMDEFYGSKNKKFPEESTVLTEFLNWSASQTTGFDQFYIAPLILTVTTKINIDKTVDSVFGNLDQLLFGKVSDLFKDVNGASPSHQINKMIGSFVQFLKIIATKMAYMLWYKKLRVDDDLVMMILRDLVLAANGDVMLEEAFFKAIADYNKETAVLQDPKKEERKQKADANKAAGKATETTPDALSGEDVEDLGSALDAQDDTWDEGANFEEGI
jgi:hypothetical protein